MKFGQKIRVSNFELVKTVRSLSKTEIAMLRKELGYPDGLKKHVTRVRIPYITAHTISGTWSVSWAAGMAMFNIIDTAIEDDGNFVKGYDKSINGLLHFMFNDTCVVGDSEYLQAKGKAMEDFLSRIKAGEEDEQKGGSDE